jgi:hypothetical protein
MAVSVQMRPVTSDTLRPWIAIVFNFLVPFLFIPFQLLQTHLPTLTGHGKFVHGCSLFADPLRPEGHSLYDVTGFCVSCCPARRAPAPT